MTVNAELSEGNDYSEIEPMDEGSDDAFSFRL